MRPALLALAGLTIVTTAPATALAGWSEAARIAPSDGSQLASAEVAGGGGGRALAAWVRSSGGAADARVLVASGTRGRWGVPRALSGRGASRPRAAINTLGDAAVAWINDGAIVAAVRRGPAGRWSVARVAEADGAVHDLRLSIDRSGRPAVLWSESREGGFVARIAARASVRAGWSVRPARIATPGPTPPALALGPGSGALVAWTQGSRALGARTVRGDFEQPVEISPEARSRPAVAIGRSGTLLTAWSAQLPGGTSVVLAAGREDAGQVWGESEDVGIGATPVAALNDDGDAVIAWSLAAPGAPQGVEAATRSGGGIWRASTVVPRRSCGCALRVGGVAIDDDGTAVVAWRRDEQGRPPGGGAAALAAGEADWQRATVGSGRPDAPPAVAAAAGAGPVAVWASARDGVRAAVLRP
jgi:hypothetical protein